MRVLSPRMLPPEMGLDGSTLRTATRSPALADQVHAESVDEGALADARHAGDADAPRFAGGGQNRIEHPRRQFAIGWEIAFHHRDGARENDAVAAQNALRVAFERQPTPVMERARRHESDCAPWRGQSCLQRRQSWRRFLARAESQVAQREEMSRRLSTQQGLTARATRLRGTNRTHQRMKDFLRADRDHGAGAEHAGHARLE